MRPRHAGGRALLLLVALLGVPLGIVRPGAPIRSAYDPLPVLSEAVFEASADGWQWRVSAPAGTVRPIVGADSQLYTAVEAPGWATSAKPGAPALPYTTTLVVLPPTGDVQLDVLPLDETPHPLVAPVAPAPAPQLRNAAEAGFESDSVWALDRAHYAGGELFPSDWVTLTELGIFRGVRLGQLTAYPFRYDAAGARLLIAGELRVALRFEEGFDAPSRSALNLDPLHAGLLPLVLNPEALLHAASHPVPPTRSGADRQLAETDWVQVSLSEAGLYALPWQTLVESGIVPVDGDPARVHIWRAADGTEIAPAWEPDPQRFVLYAEPVASRWADHEVYRITYEEQPGRRMASRPCASPSPYQVYLPLMMASDGGAYQGPAAHVWVEVTAEENRHYTSLYTSPRDGQSWYWACLQQPASVACPTAFSHTLAIDAPSAVGEAEIQLWMQGYTRSDHRVRIVVNGTDVGTVGWTGKTAHAPTVRFPSKLLREGDNTVRLERVSDGVGGVWLDAFAVRHDIAAVPALPLRFTGQPGTHRFHLQGVARDARLYDITDPDEPARLVGCPWQAETLRIADLRDGPVTYLLTDTAPQTLSDLRPPAPWPATADGFAGADYIAVAPQAWMDALQPLLRHREAQGLSTFAAPLAAIYDRYGDGRQDPEAIRAFVSDAYHTWTPQPRYLLLVGDGTWDPLNYLGADTPTWLPPYLVDVDPWMGEVPADNRYAAVDGEDLLPDLAVGRLPVNSVAELGHVIDKILTYERDTSVALWKVNHLFVVDNDDGVNTFSASADAVTPLAPVTHTIAMLRMPGAAVDDLGTERAALLSHLRRGALVVNWIGHSSWQQWEHRRLFHTDDLPALPRGERLPLVLEMTCFTSNFAHPEPKHTALDEALVRLPEAGALATWGSSGGGLNSAHQTLHAAAYTALFGPAQPRVGEATMVAKLMAPASAPHLLDTFHLFGDPALVLQRSPRPHTVYLPLLSRGGQHRVYLSDGISLMRPSVMLSSRGEWPSAALRFRIPGQQ